jgi:hypothetical protein
MESGKRFPLHTEIEFPAEEKFMRKFPGIEDFTFGTQIASME